MNNNKNMRVINRDGEYEPVSFDKIKERIELESTNLNIDVIEISQKVITGLYDGIKTSELDELTSQIATDHQTTHPDYGILASRIIISNNHRSTPATFSASIDLLYHNKDINGEHSPLISEEMYQIIKQNSENEEIDQEDKIDNMIVDERDYLFDYFGFKTMERGYLLKIEDKIIERPQYMLMRVALQLHKTNLKDVKETYDLMSQKYFIHASPTLFNSCGVRPQLSSCYLLGIYDNLENILGTVNKCGQIQKWAGGLGVHIHDVRAKGSIIRGTGGPSDGIVNMLKLYNQLSIYVNQGGRRNGSIAIYLEPWHADIMEFIELRRKVGEEEKRARELFYALWIPDLFMKRVKNDDIWTLMCPDQSPGLAKVHSEEFEELYTKYEREGRFVRQIKARDLYYEIIKIRIEEGVPYMLFKDSCNRKSNQQNLGTIQSSNLCVTGDTKILTDKGYYPIKSLRDQEVNVWNGNEFSKTIVRLTNKGMNINKIKCSNGTILKCTDNHIFIDEDGLEIKAKDLKEGQKLIKFELPVIDSKLEVCEYKHPYTHGFYCGDGTDNGEQKRLHLYKKKKDLVPHLEVNNCTQPKSSDRLNCSLSRDYPDKYQVPINCDLKTKLKWLAGIVDADGSVTKNEGSKSLYISSSNKQFLIDIILMLQTMGTNPKLVKASKSGLAKFPTGYYHVKSVYRVLVSGVDLYKLVELGFKTHNHNLERITKPGKDIRKYITVLSNKKLDQLEDVYCFNESKLHRGVFNGLLTGQCTEIIEYTAPDEFSVCSLSSIGLPTYLLYDQKNPDKLPKFDFKQLKYVAGVITKNLNKVIDNSYYPVPETKNSNIKHRPIGIGIQGLADLFCKLKIAFDSEEAKQLNKDIFETIYYGAVEASCDLAKIYSTYSSYLGSPISKGLLQFDLWGVKPSERWNWDKLKKRIAKYGVRNSLLIAPMPTASTSNILGFSECFEPYTSNIFARKVLSGEFIVLNNDLLYDLIKLGIWTPELKDKILSNNGSVQGIEEIPENIQKIYKTVWDISQKTVIDMAADRGPFICQSMSMNLYLKDPTIAQISSMDFYAWERGLKTGQYYLRTEPAVQAIKITVNENIETNEFVTGSRSNSNVTEVTSNNQVFVCRMQEGCVSCSG